MKQEIYKLELLLLDSKVRQSPGKMGELIADDFIEFGSSGNIYHKEDVIPSGVIKSFSIKDFEVAKLSSKVMLATYKITIDSIASLRSSIWKFNGVNWQMIFHQGTKCWGKEE